MAHRTVIAIEHGHVDLNDVDAGAEDRLLTCGGAVWPAWPPSGGGTDDGRSAEGGEHRRERRPQCHALLIASIASANVSISSSVV